MLEQMKSCPVTAHRQTGNGAASFCGVRAIIGVNPRDHLVHHKGFVLVAVPHIRRVVRHDNNHFHGGTIGNRRICDGLHATISPIQVVAVHAVQQIKNRIPLARIGAV